MKIISNIFIFIISCLLFLNSCSDEPNDVGEGILPEKDALKIYTDTISAISDTAYLSQIRGSHTRLLLGNYENIQAWTLLRFVGFNSISKTDSVISAELKFRVNYRFKDTTGYLKFNVYEIYKGWDDGTFTWDSVKRNDLYNNSPVTSKSYTIGSEDSLEFGIEPLVRQWIRDSIANPNGILLIPDSLSTNIILGFNNETLSLKPYLRVIFQDTNRANDTLYFFATQSTFVANVLLPDTKNIRYIQAGVAYRYSINFNPNYFIKRKNVSITEATLRISVNIDSSFLNSYTDKRLAAYFTNESVPPFSYLTYGTYCEYRDSLRIFSSDVRNIVQQWVIGNPNPVIVLRAINETKSADRFALYSTTASDTLKPQLIIKYTTLPQ